MSKELKNWDFDLNEQIIKKANDFHTKPAPGMLIGTYLLKYLVHSLGEVKGKLHIVAETGGCFVDVPQAILQRTIGNKYLRYKRLGNVAYTGYGRLDTEKALRVYVDVQKIDKEKYPMLYGFFTGGRPHDKYDRQTLNKITKEEFLKVKFDIFAKEWVKIKDIPYKLDMPVKKICRKCDNTFATKNPEDTLCKMCSSPEKNKYYEEIK
ncbi:MAG: FmdE family protein [Candidatus Muiribacteriota bacterium]